MNRAAMRLGGGWGAVAAAPGGCKRAYWMLLAYFDSAKSDGYCGWRRDVRIEVPSTSGEVATGKKSAEQHGLPYLFVPSPPFAPFLPTSSSQYILALYRLSPVLYPLSHSILHH